MSRIWLFFIENRALSYLLMGALLLIGVTSLFSIRRESAPEVQIPIAVVTSTLPGASPSDVETLIVEEIERAVAQIEDVKKITGTAREGVGTVVVEFEAQADLASSIQDVKDEVDRVRGDLPEDATDPLVTEVNFADQPIILASMVSDLPVSEFRREAEDLAEAIEEVRGVSRAEVTGIRAREVTVIVRKEALTLHNITLDEVVAAIRSNDVAVPVGSLTVEGVSYPLALEGRITNPTEVAAIPVVTRTGTTLHLADIAFIADGVEDPTTLARVSDGGEAPLQAATLMVYKQSGADITRLSRDVAELLATRNGEDTGTRVLITYDAGKDIIRDLSQLGSTGLQTILLVLLVLFLALGWREALIAALSIPLSFLTAITVMQATGNTLNFISLFSLILAIGILVDTAIVMTEAIHTNVKRGLSKREAVRRAIHDFHYPVTTGNLTTIAVFAPLLTISGITGEFIASIPFTVIAVLVSSLVISLTFIPLLASLFLHRESTGMEERQESYLYHLEAWYRRAVARLLDSRRAKHTLAYGLAVTLVVLMTFPFVGLIKVAFFPQSDVDFLYINLEEPQGTPLERTDLSIRTIEDAILDIPEIDFFTTTVGAGSAFDQNPRSGARFASVTINLNTERERTSTEILADIESRLAPYTDLNYRVLQPSEGPPSGAPVLVTFYGDDTETLKHIANNAADILREIPGTRAVSSSAEDDASEFTLTIDRATAAEFGVSPAQIAGTLRTAVFGTTATTIKEGGDEIDIVVKLDLNSSWQTPRETSYANLDALSELPIATPRGTVLLGSMLRTSLSASSDTISREDQKRIASASSQVADGYVAREVSAKFKTNFEEKVEMPTGITMKLGGETEDVDQSFADTFRALGLGILLMFAVLVVQFNKFRQVFIVLATVPLSLIGVLLGLLITREYLSFPSMLGFIALAGVVVNNAIILVDVWNTLRREHPDRPVRDIVIDGAVMRLRPILLTTVTTIVGIAPLIFASDLWRPIAVAIMFGLLFAVVLTLLFVPSLYLKFCKSRLAPDERSHPDNGTDEAGERPMEHISTVLKERYEVSSLIKGLLVMLVGASLTLPISTSAYTYDSENIHYAYQEAPATFTVDETGAAVGSTVSGMLFSQRNVTLDPSVRLQRFDIGLAYWYVSDHGIIWADSDLAALSIYLSLV